MAQSFPHQAGADAFIYSSQWVYLLYRKAFRYVNTFPLLDLSVLQKPGKCDILASYIHLQRPKGMQIQEITVIL